MALLGLGGGLEGATEARVETAAAPLAAALAALDAEGRATTGILLDLREPVTDDARVRAGRAAALWRDGRTDEAIALVRELEGESAVVGVVRRRAEPVDSRHPLSMPTAVRVGGATHVVEPRILQSLNTGTLWAVLRLHDAAAGTWGWEAYRSGNNGASWAAADSYLTSSTVDELDVAPVGDYVYVAYRRGGTSARIARYVAQLGTLDAAYGHVQMVGSNDLGHLALVSNQDAGNNRLHLLVGDLLTLRWWLTDDEGGVGTLPWTAVNHGATPLANGSPLAAAWRLYASDYPVVVAYYTGVPSLAVLQWSPAHEVESTFPWDGQMGAIAVAGIAGETFVVSPFTSPSSGAGLRLRWSNNYGSSWTTESYATPDAGETDVNPRLSAQPDGACAGLAHRHSADDGSSSALHFSTRGCLFNVSEWVGPNRFDFPVSEGTDWLGFDVRPLPFGPTANGAVWVSNDPEPGAVYFEWILPWLFVDDFDSGGTGAWSAVVP